MIPAQLVDVLRHAVQGVVGFVEGLILICMRFVIHPNLSMFCFESVGGGQHVGQDVLVIVPGLRHRERERQRPREIDREMEREREREIERKIESFNASRDPSRILCFTPGMISAGKSFCPPLVADSMAS